MDLWTLHVFEVLQQPFRMASKGRKPSWTRDCMWIFKALCAPPPPMLCKKEREREGRVSPYFQESQNPWQLPSPSPALFKFTPSSSTTRITLGVFGSLPCATTAWLVVHFSSCPVPAPQMAHSDLGGAKNWRFVTGYLWPSTSNRQRSREPLMIPEGWVLSSYSLAFLDSNC